VSKRRAHAEAEDVNMKHGAWVLIVACGSAWAGASSGAVEPLQPPAGYLAPVHLKPGRIEPCEPAPAPYTARLDFPSKYEGSNSARDQLNTAAEARYETLTQPITTMEKGFTKAVDQYLQSGDAARVECAIRWIDSWASARAMLGEATNHTGKALRKWSLGSFSGGWLKLKFSSTAPLAKYPQETARVEAWLGDVAIRVALEWSPNEKIGKINNHYYWAAWALMATAVATNRRELFDDALGTLRVFAKQADADGFLPNELKRGTRAANYHDYAMLPVAMIGAFAKANGVEVDPAVSRLATRAWAALENPASFASRAGAKQEAPDVDSKTNWSWLEPYCWTFRCAPEWIAKRDSMRPLGTTRLGGNLSAVFSTSGALPSAPVANKPTAATTNAVSGGLDALNQMCRSTIEKGDYDEAQRICKRISFDAESMAPGSSAHITSLLNMGDVKARTENYVDADQFYARALRFVESPDGADSEQAADILASMMEFKVRRGKYLDAAELSKRVLAIREKLDGADSVRAALARARYADLLSQSHQFPEAEVVYGRAIAVLERAGASQAEPLALTVQHLGEMFERRSQYAQAETQYRRVVSIAERSGLSYRVLAGALDRVAYACEQQDKNTEAATYYRRALQTLRGTPTPAAVLTRIEARLAALGSAPDTASTPPAAPGMAPSAAPVAHSPARSAAPSETNEQLPAQPATPTDTSPPSQPATTAAEGTQ
jgi:poly(beta-D-mannuronate) lyase